MDKSYFNTIILFILGSYLIAAPFLPVINPLNIKLGGVTLFGFIFLISGVFNSYAKTILSSKIAKIVILLLLVVAVLAFSYSLMSISSNYNWLIFIAFSITGVIAFVVIIYLSNKRELSKIKQGTELLDDFKYEEALEYFNEYLKIKPDNPLALSAKALTLLELNNSEKALEYSNKALDIKLGINKYFVKDSINSVRIFVKSMILSDLKKYNEALKCFDQVLKISPNSFVAWNNKGIVFDKLGNYREAMDCFNKALHFNSKDVYALSSKGKTLRNIGKCQEAMECMDKALEINPKIPLAWFNKGETLIKMDKNEEGIKCIDKALELNPHYKEALEAKEKIKRYG